MFPVFLKLHTEPSNVVYRYVFLVICWINIEIIMPYTKPAKEQSLSEAISRRGKTIPFGTKSKTTTKNITYAKTKKK